jgi:carbon-monoxide dehydrogenase small subunit
LSKHLLKFNVNGKDQALVVESHERLIDVLRDRLNLKGTKEGCSTGDCATCVVIKDGVTVNSCIVFAIQARGSRITTIEGIGTPDKLHPLQRTFIDYGATQCGFCIPGMIVAGKELLDRIPDPSEPQIREVIAGNLCRCTGYTKIVEAIQMAAREIRGVK